MDDLFDLTPIAAAPHDRGRLEMIARRPAEDERDTPESVRLDPAFGVEGDRWLEHGRSSATGVADPATQVTLINTRVLATIEPDRSRWALAGDQLYVDFDLSLDALPPGSRISVGEAVLEVSDKPHTGCSKFSARFGSDALRWINSPTGRAHRMRGMNARVIQGGTVRVGDPIQRI